MKQRCPRFGKSDTSVVPPLFRIRFQTYLGIPALFGVTCLPFEPFAAEVTPTNPDKPPPAYLTSYRMPAVCLDQPHLRTSPTHSYLPSSSSHSFLPTKHILQTRPLRVLRVLRTIKPLSSRIPTASHGGPTLLGPSSASFKRARVEPVILSDLHLESSTTT